MTRVIVQPNQTLFDLAAQHLGSAEGVFALAMLNGLSVTSVLVAGQSLELSEIVDPRIVTEIRNSTQEPAASVDVGPEEQEGIGFWVIGSTFIVS